MTRVVCAQLAPRIGSLEVNRRLCRTAVRDAVAAGAEVVVLPELATSGYVFSSRAEAAEVAITADHPVLADWAAEVGSGIVVGGFCEAGPDGTVFNSAALADKDGVHAVYRKTHLWDREKLIFTPGSTGPVALDTPIGRVGVLICYDLEFPEMVRTLALAGAELIAVPTNWPLMPRPAGERAGEVVNAMAAARLNRVPIACCDRAGTERGVDWTEGTSIVDEQGWVIAGVGPGVGVASADLDLALGRNKRITEHNDVLADRRPELYQSLTTPHHP